MSGLFWLIALLALAAIAMVLWVVPTPAAHLQNRESAMVRGSFRTVLTNPRLLKLNLGILCVHTLLMSSFVALPPLLERAGLPRDDQWQAYLVTMLMAFVSVVPFIIYAEKHRQMKRVFIGCVVVMLAAELVLWQSGSAAVGPARRVAALLHRLQRDGGAAAVAHQQGVPAGLQGGTAMGSTPPASSSGSPSAAASAACSTAWGRPLVFGGCAALALVWLGVSLTMAEPLCEQPAHRAAGRVEATPALEQRIRARDGVSDVLLVREEHSLYVKVDSKRLTRSDLERLVSL